MKLSPDYQETRFAVAMFVLTVSALALFTHFITGTQWLTVSGGVISLFTAHSLLDDKWPDRPNTNV